MACDAIVCYKQFCCRRGGLLGRATLIILDQVFILALSSRARDSSAFRPSILSGSSRFLHQALEKIGGPWDSTSLLRTLQAIPASYPHIFTKSPHHPYQFHRRVTRHHLPLSATGSSKSWGVPFGSFFLAKVMVDFLKGRRGPRYPLV